MFPLPVVYYHILVSRNSRGNGNWASVILALAYSEVPVLANPGSHKFAGTVWTEARKGLVDFSMKLAISIIHLPLEIL